MSCAAGKPQKGCKQLSSQLTELPLQSVHVAAQVVKAADSSWAQACKASEEDLANVLESQDSLDSQLSDDTSIKDNLSPPSASPCSRPPLCFPLGSLAMRRGQTTLAAVCISPDDFLPAAQPPNILPSSCSPEDETTEESCTYSKTQLACDRWFARCRCAHLAQWHPATCHSLCSIEILLDQ